MTRLSELIVTNSIIFYCLLQVATLFSRFALSHSEDIPFTLNWPITNILLWCNVIEGLITLLILLTVDSIVPSWIFNRKKKCSSKSITQTHYQPNLTNVTDVNMTLTNSDVKGKNFSRQQHPQLHLHPQSQQFQLNNNRSNGIVMTSSGLPTGQPQQVDFKTNKFPITNGSLFASLTAAAAANPYKGGKPNLSRGILQQLVDNNIGAY